MQAIVQSARGWLKNGRRDGKRQPAMGKNSRKDIILRIGFQLSALWSVHLPERSLTRGHPTANAAFLLLQRVGQARSISEYTDGDSRHRMKVLRYAQCFSGMVGIEPRHLMNEQAERARLKGQMRDSLSEIVASMGIGGALMLLGRNGQEVDEADPPAGSG